MALVKQSSGCKVGWETYDNLPEAEAASVRARAEAHSKAGRGYDFGYCVPGEIRHVADHSEHGECWIVTTP
jgi:hypothetical protein